VADIAEPKAVASRTFIFGQLLDCRVEFKEQRAFARIANEALDPAEAGKPHARLTGSTRWILELA
jgi:hypothetical protein